MSVSGSICTATCGSPPAVTNTYFEKFAGMSGAVLEIEPADSFVLNGIPIDIRPSLPCVDALIGLGAGRASEVCNAAVELEHRIRQHVDVKL